MRLVIKAVLLRRSDRGEVSEKTAPHPDPSLSAKPPATEFPLTPALSLREREKRSHPKEAPPESGVVVPLPRRRYLSNFQPVQATNNKQKMPAILQARRSRRASSKRRNTFADSVSVKPMVLMRRSTRSAKPMAPGKESQVQKRSERRKYPSSLSRETGNKNDEPTVSSSIILNEPSGFMVSRRQKS